MIAPAELVRSAFRLGLAAALGAVFAAALSQIWGLDTRWFYVTIIGILGVSAAMFCMSFFAEFLLILLLFAVPFAGFGKWLIPDNLRETVWSSAAHNATLEGAIGVGVVDFLVFGLYLHWFLRIFILRSEKPPKPVVMDAFILMFLLAYIVSIPGTAKVFLGIHATVYLIKFLFLYFYISRHFRTRHIPWFLASLVFAAVVEGGLGLVQYSTGKLVGLGLDKGSGSSLDYQYLVPGTEKWSRATGSLYDSHTLGLYLAMLMPFFLVYTLDRGTRFDLRAVYASSFLVSFGVLLMTFTRSGWVAAAVSLCIAIALLLVIWRQTQVIPFLVLCAFALVFTFPWTVELIIQRFENSPIETITTRLEGYEVALYIWSKHPLFGFGVGNYIEALWKYNYGWNQDVIVHNTILWLGSETGIFGLIAFYGTITIAMYRMWRLVLGPRTQYSLIAFGVLIALIAFVVEGQATPMHREPTTFTFFWLLIALSVAVPELAKQEQQPGESEGRDPGHRNPEKIIRREPPGRHT